MNVISNQLHKNGQRLTKQREVILSALTHSPLSVSEVSKSLKSKGLKIDKVTLYRTLDCFTTLGLVGKTRFRDNSSKYELLENNCHHHHIMCDSCGKIEDVPLNENGLLSSVKRKTKFIINSHSLEFFGICTGCQRSSKIHND